MDYFPHDTDARYDLKIKKLRATYGNDGYTFYFIMLENIYRTKAYELDISDEDTILILLEETKLSEKRFKEILSKCLELGLFDEALYTERKILTSNAIKVRTEPIENKRRISRLHYDESKVSASQANDSIEISDTEISTEITQSIEKEKIRNERRREDTLVEEEISYEDIKKLYNSICSTLPKVDYISNNRWFSINDIWKEHPNIEFFKELFERVNESDFLSGRNGKWKKCSFGWIIEEEHMKNIIEGKYDNKETSVKENKWEGIES